MPQYRINRSSVEVMQLEGIQDATHIVHSYRFQGQVGAIHEDLNDNVEHVADTQLFRTLVRNEIKNALVIEVAQWKRARTRTFFLMCDDKLSAATTRVLLKRGTE